MAVHKLFLDQRSKNSSAFPLKIRISHKSKEDYISTEYKLRINEWNDDSQKIIPPFKNCGKANARISNASAIVQKVIEELKPHAKQLTVKQYKSVAEKALKEDQDNKSKTLKNTGFSSVLNETVDTTPVFFNYAQRVADRFYLNDQSGSAAIIEGMIESFSSFTRKLNLSFKEIDKKLLEDYEQWYLARTNKKGKPNSVNSLAFYTKEIRRVFNLAIEDEKCSVTKELYPFGKKKYSIKNEKKGHKNVPASEIAKVFQLNLEKETRLWHHQNYFMYYFECWGMNFADIAHLRVYQVKDGRTKYRRRKTKYKKNAKTFDIEHSPMAQKIIDYYTAGKKDGDYVFPILDDLKHLLSKVKDKNGDIDEATEIENKKLFQKKFKHIRSNHIRRLTTIAKRAGMSSNLTTYIGRHSFFSIALKSGVSKSEISEMAGHADFKTTEDYMEGFDLEQLDQSANKVRQRIALSNLLKEEKPLLTPLLILKSNRVMTAESFLMKACRGKVITEQKKAEILLKIISETDCKNGDKALSLINSYIEKLNEGLPLKIAKSA